MAQPGDIDAAFANNVLTHGGADQSIFCTAVRPDGRILVGGTFTHFGGLPANRLACMKPDGTLDTAFTSGITITGLQVTAIAALSDGSVLIGGNFSEVNGVARSHFARIDANGALDLGFDPVFNLPVFCIHPRGDGEVLVGGQFSSVDGTTRRSIALIDGTGNLDTGFNAGPLNNLVSDIAIMKDGRVVIGGQFTSVAGTPRARIAVLSSTGTLDTDFAPTAGPDDQVFAVACDDLDRVLVGGNFDNVNGSSQPALVRFTANGSTDATFNVPSGFDLSDGVLDLIVYPDGSLICAGTFADLAGASSNRLVRMTSTGALDASFNVGTGFTGASVSQLVMQPDGRIVTVGSFTSYRGTAQNRVTRLLDCAPVAFYPDLDQDGYGAPGPALVTCHPPSGYVSNNGDCDDADTNSHPFSSCYDNDALTVNDVFDGACVCAGQSQAVQARVMLEGPFNGTDMNDGLRTAGAIPLSEPYTALGTFGATPFGGGTILPTVLNVTGNDAIVDWVVLALRTGENGATVASMRAALLQRDGDVVDLDGTSPVRFAAVPGAYHVQIMHRNHLSATTASSLQGAAPGQPIVVDFTSPATVCHGTNARKTAGSTMVLWGGNVTNNGVLSYTGSNNDRDPILVKVGSTTPNNTVNGYFREDVDMNGSVQYTGAGNDRDRILINIGGATPNNVRLEQMP